MTQAAFLAWEERQELRYEFDGIRPVAMTGGTFAHSVVQSNLMIALGNALRGHLAEFGLIARCGDKGLEGLLIQVESGEAKLPQAAIAPLAILIKLWRLVVQLQRRADLLHAADLDLKEFAATITTMEQELPREPGNQLDRAIERGFARGAGVLVLNTNTVDHPKALDTYRKAGFRIARSESLELQDPRVLWPDIYRWPPPRQVTSK